MATGAPRVVVSTPLDIFIGSQNDSFLSIIRTNGDGTFAAPDLLIAGFQLTGVVVADFNGDGNDDIAVTDSFGVNYSLGDGGGVFTSFLIAGMLPGGVATGLAVGDFNGDGYDDIAVAKPSSSTASILLSIGGVGFAPPVDYVTNGTSLIPHIVADVTGDGNLDIVSLSGMLVNVTPGDGLGGFGPTTGYFSGIFSPSAIAVGDLTGDGRPDILVADQVMLSMSLLVSDGAGGFVPPLGIASVPSVSALELADVNGDGFLDILAAQSFGITPFINSGFGTFTPGTMLTGMTSLTSMVAGDVTGDGVVDVVATEALSGTVHVFAGLGDGTFAPGDVLLAGVTSPGQLTLGSAITRERSVTFTEGTPQIIDAALDVSDDGATLAFATVTLTGGFAGSGDDLSVTLPMGMVSSFVSGTLTIFGPATVADFEAALRSLTFTSGDNPDNGGANPSRQLSIVVDDGTGGVSEPVVVNIDIVAVNDAPSGQDKTITIDEDVSGGYVLTAADFGFSDVDGNELAGVVITGVSSNGTLTLDGVALSANDPVTVADITSGKLVYTPDANGFGTAFDSFTFKVVDDGGTASGGADTASAANTITFDVDAVNDAPELTATGGTTTFWEGQAAADLFSGVATSTVETGQSITGITLTVDNLADGADEILSIDSMDVALVDGTSITTSDNGFSVSVTVSGTTATVTLSKIGGMTAGEADSLIDGLAYANTSDTPSTATDRVVTLTQIADDGGTANGGVDTASLSVSATVSVVAAEEASFVVTTLDDVVDAFDGKTSLREALTLAGSDPDANTITFDASLAGGTIVLTSGPLYITSDVTIDGDIDGDDVADIILSGDVNQDDARQVDDLSTDVDESLLSLVDPSGYGNTSDNVQVIGVFNASATLNGLIITGGNSGSGGYSGFGGGVVAFNYASVTVTNSLVSGNMAQVYGGGIAGAPDSTVVIENTTVSGNFAAGGGGVFTMGDLTITGSTIAGNTAVFGGGVVNSGTMTMEDSSVIGNVGYGYSGGVANAGTALITRSLIANNQTYGDGGGVTSSMGGYGPSSLTIVDSVISGNSADGYGGGVQTSGVTTLVNTAVIGNTAGESGGGIANDGCGCGSSVLSLVNTTVAGNSAGYYGGGLDNQGAAVISNSTFTGNVAGEYGGGIYLEDGFPLVIANSIIAGNEATIDGADVLVDGSAALSLLGGNILGSTLSGTGTGSAPLVIDGSTRTGLETVFQDVSTDPLTGVLSGVATNNGGSVPTVLIIEGGLAHNTGDSSVLPIDFLDLDGDLSTVDPFPVDGRGYDRVVGTNVDIGAVERQSATAVDDAVSTDEQSIVSGDVFGANPATGDSSIDGPLVVTHVNGVTASVGNQITLASGALLTLRADGTFDYDPNGRFNDLPDIGSSGASNISRTDSFTYTLVGGSTATVTVTVNGVDSDGDVLRGRDGVADVLLGGIGADRFVFERISEIGLLPGSRDLVNDFQQGIDLIDFDRLDALSTVAGLHHFKFIGTLAHDGSGATLNYVLEPGKTLVTGDVNADGVADFVLELKGQFNLTAADFTSGSIRAVHGGSGNDRLFGALTGKPMYGFDGNDTIVGGAGNDTIYGGAGFDRMTGGGGSDVFVFSALSHMARPGDVRFDVITDFQQGSDLIDLSGVDSRLSIPGNQAFTFVGTENHGAGGGTLRYQHGNGSTFIYGDIDGDGSGDFSIRLDGLINLTAADFVAGSISAVRGSSGSDLLIGATNGSRITGWEGNDTIIGGAGNDTIIGGAGYDLLTGGGGADVFVFNAVQHLGKPGVPGHDIITDFQQGIDIIDLSGIDADWNVAGNQAFTFVGDGPHGGAGGTLRYLKAGGNTFIYGDVDADGAGDFTIRLAGLFDLTASDFIL